MKFELQELEANYYVTSRAFSYVRTVLQGENPEISHIHTYYVCHKANQRSRHFYAKTVDNRKRSTIFKLEHLQDF